MTVWGKKRDRVNEILLYAVVVEFLLYGHLWSAMEVTGYPYLFLYWGSICLGILKICIQGNTWKEWILAGILGIIAICSWRGSDDKHVLLMMLGICMAKDVKPDRLIKVDLVTEVLISGAMLLLPFLGVIPMMLFHDRGIDRLCFGWATPNTMGLSFTIICLEWMYLRHRKFRWYDYLGILAMLILLDRTANSRTAEVLIILILLEEFAMSFYDRFRCRLPEYKIWTAGCTLCLAGALALPAFAMAWYFLDNESLMALYGNFIGRFQIPGRYLTAHGISLFGSPYNPDVYEYLDMYFAYAPLHLGIIVAIVSLVLMIRLVVFAYKKKDEKLLLFFMFILLRSTIESEHFTLVCAFFPVLLGIPLWNSEKG